MFASVFSDNVVEPGDFFLSINSDLRIKYGEKSMKMSHEWALCFSLFFFFVFVFFFDNFLKTILERRKNFILESKPWTKVEIPVNDECCNLTWLFYSKHVKSVTNYFRKIHASCWTVFPTKQNTFTDRYDKSNDCIRFQPLLVFRFLKFITMV